MYFHFQCVFCILITHSAVVSLDNNVRDMLETCDFGNGIRLKAEYPPLRTEKQEIIYWSPCHRDRVKSSCPENVLVCLKRSQNAGKPLINLGSSFAVLDEDLVKHYRLESQNAETCKEDTTKKYITYISFQTHSPEAIPTREPCTYHIALPDPTIEYPCTKREDGFLLDFRTLTEDFTVKTVNNTYKFNLCKAVGGCDDPTAASCVRGSRNNTLGLASTRRIIYDGNSGAVQFNFKIGSAKRRLSTTIDLQCNWDTAYGKATYIPTPSLKSTKFVVQSVLGCVKLPMDCTYRDFQNYVYDWSDLYRTHGWDVQNNLNRTIRINLCGRLENPPGACQDRHSQICETKGSGQLSHGSILADTEHKGDILQMRLKHGSICPHNSTFTLSTDLSFKCALAEKGPRLLKVNNCSMEIYWETPKACPLIMETGDTLDRPDPLGRRDLRGLCRGDQTHPVSKSSRITYNLCSRLKQTCNGFPDVNACLDVNGKQSVLGFYTKDNVHNRNGLISVEVSGEFCKQLNFSFICDYDAALSGQANLKVIRDNCAYQMEISTPAACFTKQPPNLSQSCTVIHKNSVYNLTKLAQAKRNYEYFNKEENVTYILNICNPVITGPDALCKLGSGICMENFMEANIKHRFFTIASQPSELRVEDGMPVMIFESGDVCQNGRSATGNLQFICADKEGEVRLSSITDCEYNFTLHSKHACPQYLDTTVKLSSPCVVPTKSGIRNLTSVASKEFTVPYEDDKLTFHVCYDNYTRLYSNGSKAVMKSFRTVEGDSVIFNVSNNVCNNSSWNKIKIFLDCQEDETPVHSVQGCTGYVYCKAEVLQKNERKEKFFLSNPIGKIGFEGLGSIVEKTIDRFKNNKTPSQLPSEKSKEKAQSLTENSSQNEKDDSGKISAPIESLSICKVIYHSSEINLNDLDSNLVSAKSGNQYSVGLKRSRSCKGYICKGNVSVASLERCPNITEENSIIKAVFNNTYLTDGFFTTTMMFTCNYSAASPSVYSETDHSLTLSYPLDRLCVTAKANGGLIAGIVICILVIFAGSGVVLKRKRKFPFRRQGNKSQLLLYQRDSQC